MLFLGHQSTEPLGNLSLRQPPLRPLNEDDDDDNYDSDIYSHANPVFFPEYAFNCGLFCK